MARPEGWEIRLSEALERYVEAPFAWGKTDCFTLCADVAQALLLEDRCPPEWRSYETPEDTARLLKRFGFKDVADAFATIFEEIHPALAQRGDIGRARYPGAEMGGGVVFIGHEVVGKGAHGLIRLPVSAVQRAFRVV